MQVKDNQMISLIIQLSITIIRDEASENLGMAMIYTLVSSAKDWLSELFAQDNVNDNDEEEVAKKDEVIVPHGEPVTIDTFLAWRERFEAELALERAKLMPESALASTKEKKLSGRQWFETVYIYYVNSDGGDAHQGPNTSHSRAGGREEDDHDSRMIVS